jgi:hypothetical protein
MTPEQMLLAALGIVTGWLLVMAKILWGRSEECEHDRRSLRQEIEDVKTLNGELRGFASAVELCQKKDCAFARPGPARHQEGSRWGQSMVKKLHHPTTPDDEK